MFDQIERELLNGEPLLIGYQSQLLILPQLLDEKEPKIVDIWELQPQKSPHREGVIEPDLNLSWFFSKLNLFSLKVIANKTKKRLI